MLSNFKILIILTLLTGHLYAQESDFMKSRIAILYSELTEKYRTSNSLDLTEVITYWELFLMQNKVSYKVIYDDDLESGIEDDFDILILPSVEIVSIDELKQLEKFLQAGKSIICSGSKLFLKDATAYKYQNLETLFNLSGIESIASSKTGFMHTLKPNHLNNFSLSSELILQISAKNQPLICSIQKNKMYDCGNIYSENNITSEKSSLIYGSVGDGKFLWAGFDLNDIVGGVDQLLTYKSLIINTINWMDNKHDAYIDNFPDNLSEPIIAAIQYNNALQSNLIDSIKQNDIIPHLIVNPNQIVSKEILSKFSDNEIIFDLTALSSDLKLEIITDLLENFKNDYDVSISSILVEDNFIAINDPEEIKKIGINTVLYYSPVAGLPQTDKYDLLIIPFYKIAEIPGSNKTINFLSFVPAIDCKKNPEDELFRTINLLKSNGHNFTSIESINKWWRIKDLISLQLKNTKDSEFELMLTNKNFVAINDLNVYLDCFKKIDLSSLTISLNDAPLNYYLDDTAKVIVISLDKIPPDSINRIKIKFSLE